MKNNIILIVYPDNDSEDMIERFQFFLADETIKKLINWDNRWKIELSDIEHNKIKRVLKSKSKTSILALFGHGRFRDGALIRTDEHVGIESGDYRLLKDKSIFAFYCYSSKLFTGIFKKASGQNLPSKFVGFKDQIWLVGLPSKGKTYECFHKPAWGSLKVLLSQNDAELAAKRLHYDSSKWLSKWLCALVLSALNKDYHALRTSLLCCFGLLTVVSNIFFYDNGRQRYITNSFRMVS